MIFLVAAILNFTEDMPEGVSVSGSADTSYPLSRAVALWQKGFQDTKYGAMQASVDFRFSTRMGYATTAHELGYFVTPQKKMVRTL